MSDYQRRDYWRYTDFSDVFFNANNEQSVADCDAWWNLGYV